MMVKVAFFVGITVFFVYATEASSEEVVLSTIVGDSSGGQHSLDASDGSPANAVYVDNAGYVGIGMTNPATKLHLYNDAANAEISLDAPANNTYASAVVHKRGGLKRWWVGSNNNVGADDFTWYRYDNSGNPLSPVTAMTILRASGNVGIGIAQPASNLHVYSNTSDITVTAESQLSGGKAEFVTNSGGDKASGLRVQQNGSNVLYFGGVRDSGIDWGIFDYGLSKWVMQSDGGRILFGTGNGYPTPSDPYVSVLGNGSADSFAIFDEAFNTDFMIKGDGNIAIGTNSTAGYKLYVNGTLGVNSSTANKTGGTTWGSLSDARLKEITGSFDYGLPELLKLEPIRFRYKTNKELGLSSDEEYVGFSAQSVQKVIPEAVRENDKGYLIVEADPILWAMLNAIKEQDRKIKELEKRLSALEKKDDRL